MSAIKRSLVVGFVAVALGWFGVAAAADDRAICIGPDVPNDSRTEACTRAIAPGRLSGHDLALAHNWRGFAYENKGDHDHALEDFNEATKADPTLCEPLQ